MALWKETAKSPLPNPPETLNLGRFGDSNGDEPLVQDKPAVHSAATAAPALPSASESRIAPDLVIEGKIDGAGHVRIAGRFKGDINVRGDLTIEHGATVTGSIRAERVTIGGELVGNIETAAHVELLQTGALTGDAKSATFSVAKGSRMRGHAEFGWADETPAVTSIHKNTSSGSDR